MPGPLAEKERLQVGCDRLDDIDSVFGGKPEGLRVHDEKVVVVVHDHLNGKGRDARCGYVEAFVAQNRVEAFDEDGIGGAEKNVLHNEKDNCISNARSEASDFACRVLILNSAMRRKHRDDAEKGLFLS